MFAYCGNNPVRHSDHSGNRPVAIAGPLTAPEDYHDILERAIKRLRNQMTNRFNAQLPLLGSIDEAIIYAIVEDKSDLTPCSYLYRNLSVEEKLAYVKQQTGSEYFDFNAWRYYNEYTLHEYGWRLTGWAYKKDIPIASNLAQHFYEADVHPTEWDSRWFVNLATIFLGLLGI